MTAILNLYDDLFDINLHIYKTTSELTIVEVRYYLKSSIDEEYRQEVLHNPPMLHCKIAFPSWFSAEEKEKFDINWELNYES